MSFFNPFKAVLETNKYPHAHAHRSTFAEKLWATFKVFSGNVLPGLLKNPRKYSDTELNKMHFGFFDYLTLGIPFLLTILSLMVIERKSRPIQVLGTILFLTLTVPRVLFAMALTVVSFPFVMIAHWTASFKGNALKETVMSHQIECDGNEINKKVVSNEKLVRNTKTLGNVLGEQDLSLNDIHKIELKQNGNDHLIKLSLFKEKKSEKPTLELQLCLHDKKQNTIFKALRKLNIGGLQTQIESDNKEFNVYNTI